jgi:2-keto-4-pentenoate hydratase/2-oxohepta-3-ene-1,7-dioic acid hydratase in catechol pathway
VLQDTTTNKMIHSIPRQIAYISTFIPLSPGDVIGTLPKGIRDELRSRIPFNEM